MNATGLRRRHSDLARVRFPDVHDVRDEPRPRRTVRSLLYAHRHAFLGRRERERLPAQPWVRERGGRRAGERVQLDVSLEWRQEVVLRWSAKADSVQVSELTRIGTARSCVGLGELMDLGWNALLRVLPRRVEPIPHPCYRSRGRDNEFLFTVYRRVPFSNGRDQESERLLRYSRILSRRPGSAP